MRVCLIKLSFLTLITMLAGARTQASFAQSEDLYQIGSFRLTLDSNMPAKEVSNRLRLVPIQTEPDKVISFAWTDKVIFTDQFSRQVYMSPVEMLKKLQQTRNKNFLRIRLEKRFVWVDPEERKANERHAIEFAKNTGFRRCQIVIDHAQFSNLVLTEIFDGLEVPTAKK